MNELAAKLQILENSLINNNLLQSCTIRGVTNNWFNASDGTVGVRGILFQTYLNLFFVKFFFLVDVSTLTPKITKIDRINSWFTCQGGCPSANGSNNIMQIPNQPMIFWVHLRRDSSLNPPFSAQQVKDDDFKIHYEVQGPCA